MQTVGSRYFAKVQRTPQGHKTSLLDAAQRFFLQRGDAPGNISGRGIVCNALAVIKEILTEILDHTGSLIKGILAVTAAENDLLSAEDLRNLAHQHRAAIAIQLICYHSHQGIGSNTAVAVTAAAFNRNPQFGNRNIGADILCHHCFNLVDNSTSLCDLIGAVLQIQKTHALGIHFTEERNKIGKLIIFTAQSQNQHAAGVWMTNQSPKDLPGGFMVATQLRAAVGVRPCLCTGSFRQLLGYSIGAAYRRDDPQLVTDTHISVFPKITFKGRLFKSFVGHIKRGIHPISQPGEIGFQIAGVDLLSHSNIPLGMTDGKTVFYHILPCGNGLQGIFLSVIVDFYIITWMNSHCSVPPSDRSDPHPRRTHWQAPLHRNDCG